MADWTQIKTEYITTDTSYRKLAKKYGVNYQTVCARSKAEGWIDKREQYANTTLTKTLDKISSQKARKAARIDALAEKLLDKLEQAVEELDLMITTHKVKTETETGEETREWKVSAPGGTVDRVGLQQLTVALQKIQAITGEMPELDRKEQEARIARLRREAEKQEERTDTIEVVFSAGEDSWNE